MPTGDVANQHVVLRIHQESELVRHCFLCFRTEEGRIGSSCPGINGTARTAGRVCRRVSGHGNEQHSSHVTHDHFLYHKLQFRLNSGRLLWQQANLAHIYVDLPDELVSQLASWRTSYPFLKRPLLLVFNATIHRLSVWQPLPFFRVIGSTSRTSWQQVRVFLFFSFRLLCHTSRE